jgi:hypothetical protein
VSSTTALSNPAESFGPYRRRLLGLAYRILGSMADAEDAVQETYLRWHGANRDNVSAPRAFLMTTTTRICLDVLTSARARREEYVGPWLRQQPASRRYGSSKVAASDRTTFGGFSQFVFIDRDRVSVSDGTTRDVRLDVREGRLILKRRDVRVVEGARLETDSVHAC